MNEYFNVVHWPSQKKVYEGDFHTACRFLDNLSSRIAPGPAMIEHPDYALVATSPKGGKSGKGK